MCYHTFMILIKSGLKKLQINTFSVAVDVQSNQRSLAKFSYAVIITPPILQSLAAFLEISGA